MPHGYAVADTNGLELEWNSSSDAYARFDRLAQLVQMDVAGYKLIIGVDDADEGAANLFIA
jgi:hypothetical protein